MVVHLVKSRSFSIFLVKANLSRFMAGTLGLNLVRYILLLKNLNSANLIIYTMYPGVGS